jgi:SPP1 gp7 family putative phage head morphogenesis protein
VDAMLRDIYTEGYYRTAFEIQKGTGVGYAFNTLDTRRVRTAIDSAWAMDGKNFSDRIWQNKDKLVNNLNEVLIQNIIRGENPRKAIDELAKKMNASKVNIGRVYMTESSAIAARSQEECYKELGVEEFEFLASLDDATCKICQSMDGRHFPMSEYEIGLTANPLHTGCRCTTVPYFPDDDEDSTRAARDEEGKTIQIPANMTYEQWKAKYVDNSRENVIIKSAKNIGIQGKVDVNPKPINLSRYSFDDIHINADRKHNVTREDAEKFMKEAEVSLSKWNGRFINYFSKEGAVYIDTEKKNIRTAYKIDEYDDKTKEFMKVVLNYGK